jgi:hypothetical protein
MLLSRIQIANDIGNMKDKITACIFPPFTANLEFTYHFYDNVPIEEDNFSKILFTYIEFAIGDGTLADFIAQLSRIQSVIPGDAQITTVNGYEMVKIIFSKEYK